MNEFKFLKGIACLIFFFKYCGEAFNNTELIFHLICDIYIS